MREEAVRRRPVSAVQATTLGLLLAPGALFAGLLVALPERWAGAAAHVVVIGVAGGIATAAGAADWWWHATGRRVVGPRERRVELIALAGGGLPLFALMVVASVVERPLPLLAPVLAVVAVIAALVLHDERRWHARCAPLETLFHRVLVTGQAVAWLAWAHWCFVERAAGA